MSSAKESCPWCGVVPTIANAQVDWNQGSKWARVVCSCGVCGPEVRTNYDLRANAKWIDEALKAWDERVQPTAPDGAQVVVACHRTITENGAAWAWVAGAPSLGAMDNLKVHPNWRIEYAYTALAGRHRGEGMSMIPQVAIMLTGVTAIALTQSASAQARRYACIFGLIGQPFWFWAAISAEQWGIVFVSALYTLAWAKGVYTHWFRPQPTQETPL